MIRYYLCPFVGTGSIDDPFTPLVRTVLPSSRWQFWDGRVNQGQPGGVCLAFADVTPEQHTTLAGTANVTPVPFLTHDGTPLDSSAAIGQVATVNRNAMISALEARHVPIAGLTLADSIFAVLVRVKARFRIRQYLVANDYTELLDNTVGSIPAQKRNAIRTRLEELGFDFSGISGSTTIRDALTLIITQENTLRG